MIDTNGAGDALAVGFLSSYVLDGYSLRDSVARGRSRRGIRARSERPRRVPLRRSSWSDIAVGSSRGCYCLSVTTKCSAQYPKTKRAKSMNQWKATADSKPRLTCSSAIGRPKRRNVATNMTRAHRPILEEEIREVEQAVRDDGQGNRRGPDPSPVGAVLQKRKTDRQHEVAVDGLLVDAGAERLERAQEHVLKPGSAVLEVEVQVVDQSQGEGEEDADAQISHEPILKSTDPLVVQSCEQYGAGYKREPDGDGFYNAIGEAGRVRPTARAAEEAQTGPDEGRPEADRPPPKGQNRQRPGRQRPLSPVPDARGVGAAVEGEQEVQGV